MSINEEIKKIKELGWEVITDPEKIYWDEIFLQSHMLNSGKDPRTKYEKKPILVKRGDKKFLVEPDPDGGWWVWEDNGNIIAEKENKEFALFKLRLKLEDF